MFANGLTTVGGMLLKSSSVTCAKYSLKLLAISVGSVSRVLSASGLLVGNFLV